MPAFALLLPGSVVDARCSPFSPCRAQATSSNGSSTKNMPARFFMIAFINLFAFIAPLSTHKNSLLRQRGAAGGWLTIWGSKARRRLDSARRHPIDGSHQAVQSQSQCDKQNAKHYCVRSDEPYHRQCTGIRIE